MWSGFGESSFIAPLDASTAPPIIPPSSTLPAIAAPPPPEMLEITDVVTDLYPSLVAVTEKPGFRLASIEQGVVQDSPLLKVTVDPVGSEVTENACDVPRVIVAQLDKTRANAMNTMVLFIYGLIFFYS